MKVAENSLTRELLDAVARRVEAEMGLSFAGPRSRDLERALQRMAADSGREGAGESAAECAMWLLAGDWDERKAAQCARHLTNGETYFFRERRAFDLLCDYAHQKLSDPARAGEPLRIWSAGCSTGEEAYSIAMALCRTLTREQLQRVSILATDIHADKLRSAACGVYRKWSFRIADDRLASRFFEPQPDGGVRVADALRAMVRFERLNLAAPGYPSAATGTGRMDIIFCRNVLLYFSREQARRAIARLHACLIEGGWLIVSPSEASSELFEGFVGHYHADAIHFRKLARPAKSTPGRAAPSFVPAKTATASIEQREAGARPAPVHTGGLRHMNASSPPEAESSDDAQNFYARALSEIESGRVNEALHSLRRVLYLQPDSVLACYQMGVACMALGQHEEAARRFDAAEELLDALDEDALLPGADGLHAAYLRESIRAWRNRSEA